MTGELSQLLDEEQSNVKRLVFDAVTEVWLASAPSPPQPALLLFLPTAAIQNMPNTASQCLLL